MKRTDVLDLLRNSKAEWAERFGVKQLALFGSAARHHADVFGDVDLLVEFDGTATSARYFGLQFFMEDLLGCRVVLVTKKALRADLRPFVEQEALRV